MIPKNIFFIFGLKNDFCGKPFDYFHYLNILSAKINNPEFQIYVYYHYEPKSEYFEKLRLFCKLIKIKDLESFFKENPYKYAEHVAGRLRIQLLYEHGGIYLDSDVVCCKPFNELLHLECAMGEEYGHFSNKLVIKGLCDAVIISKPRSEFLNKWIEGYKKDYRRLWNYNAVKMPFFISEENPHLIKRLNTKYFFKFCPDTEGTKQLFLETHDFSDCFCVHLWEGLNYDILKKYHIDYIIKNNDTLSNIYKTVIKAKDFYLKLL